MTTISLMPVAQASRSVPMMTVVVGNEIVKDEVAKKVTGLPICVTLAPHLGDNNSSRVGTTKYGPHSFVRDTQVCLQDGTIYIPLCNEETYLNFRFKALLPISSKKWILNRACGFGTGFRKEGQNEILSYVRTNHLPHTMGRLSLEGGSVKLWEDSSGERHGIAGNHALILSMLSLEASDFFTIERLATYKASIKEPSVEAIRRARNLDLCKNIKEPYETTIAQVNADVRSGKLTHTEAYKIKEENQKKYQARCKELGIEPTQEAYNQKLLSEPTTLEKVRYRDAAIELLAMLKLTKAVMAEQLRVPLRNFLIWKQQSFHLDQDIFVIPTLGQKGTVFYHYEPSSKRALTNSISQASSKTEKIFLSYIKASDDRDKEFRPYLLGNLKKSAKIGWNTHPLPGIFECPKEMSINFMNGLLIQDILFTNASPYVSLDRDFIDTFQAACPQVKVQMIDRGPGEGMLTFLLTESGGGMNCLTFTHFNQKIPEAFFPIKPLKNEDPIEPWEIDELGPIGDIVRSYI